MNNIAKFISMCIITFALIAFIVLPFIFSDAFGSADTETTLRLRNYEPTYVEPTPIVTNQFDQSKWSYNSYDGELTCMAMNIYFEARDQDIKGQLAVGLVTINRVLSKHYPNSICKVVWEKRKNRKEQYIAQFSWTLDGSSDTPLNLDVWMESIQVAEMLMAERSLFNIVDFTNGADHYHANYVTPFWADSLDHTITVGDHLFYSSNAVAKR